MRITSWNINSIRAREQRLADWLDAWRPDVLCLQELKCQEHQLPRHVFEERGYHVAMLGQKTYNGVAIASLSPMSDVEVGLPLEGDAEARGIAATVHGVRICNVYVVNGKAVGDPKFDFKLRWMDALGDWVEGNLDPAGEAVLCGDFNLCPTDDDTWDPAAWRGRIFCTDAERARFQRLLDHGLIDAFRAKYPSLHGRYGQTWWDYRGGGFQQGHGLRIDHFLVTKRIYDRSTSVVIDRVERAGEKPSDHAPVTLTVDLSRPDPVVGPTS